MDVLDFCKNNKSRSQDDTGPSVSFNKKITASTSAEVESDEVDESLDRIFTKNEIYAKASNIKEKYQSRLKRKEKPSKEFFSTLRDQLEASTSEAKVKSVRDPKDLIDVSKYYSNIKMKDCLKVKDKDETRTKSKNDEKVLKYFTKIQSGVESPTNSKEASPRTAPNYNYNTMFGNAGQFKNTSVENEILCQRQRMGNCPLNLDLGDSLTALKLSAGDMRPRVSPWVSRKSSIRKTPSKSTVKSPRRTKVSFDEKSKLEQSELLSAPSTSSIAYRIKGPRKDPTFEALMKDPTALEWMDVPERDQKDGYSMPEEFKKFEDKFKDMDLRFEWEAGPDDKEDPHGFTVL